MKESQPDGQSTFTTQVKKGHALRESVESSYKIIRLKITDMMKESKVYQKTIVQAD
jgi:hypothetical protein